MGGVYQIYVAHDGGKWQVACCYEHCNEISGSVKCG